MAYLLDASPLIEVANRYFAVDLSPTFWEWLCMQNAAGKLCSIDQVKCEITSGNDDLAAWARKQTVAFFHDTDPAALTCTQQVIVWVSSAGFPIQKIPQFMAGADPFIIGYAMAHNHIVITEEVGFPAERKNIKIPTICHHFNVGCVRFEEVLRALKMKATISCEPELEGDNVDTA